MNERIPALKQAELPAKGKKRGRKLLAIVIALLAIILVFLFFRSSLAKIQVINVEGASYLTAEEVKAALAVNVGDSFFVPSSGKLETRVRSLKPVKEASIVKHFPGKLTVKLQEFEEVATELGADGKVQAVLANGLVLPSKQGALPDKPILTGWKTGDANFQALCQTLSQLPDHLLTDLSEIKPDPSKSYPDRIKLYTRSRFEVVTTVGKLSEKIIFLSDIVETASLDASFCSKTYFPYSANA
ncbi:cell division protein FtsQ/DivIB [Cohnella faecalis]|uniref:Cell division protein DivIB n=1 Tax=Cohnella faecalis TaxID=2315694 RepID=A0A398CSF4_9BACL|nr:FtsQ-type POTRA domain-containing protein [Cohnella faecalis]RIE05462.1 cell division protein DivIB [Cohnella faecalis]